ncbi:fumarate/nitrate reduction transcriptional regulator Fnr [Enterobacteriaceae endosymbiont of Donacia versicolorea]|uniref:fumarate/nitrate reduction transcriptional regulator Fnr n=1 Tax=Enterobacteriaceae endosymbiont of Donacia versicolorea TaxID=2675788 RepID=UPI001449FF01|nr:fumarate/nitrate reduction transcriptional regulator Fnr [Enterobacteriaceae endosymbiont of Donacia versicolorea]QJC31956.1 fumarate/nitrate reduction transcriptional regulator Fnr [Enterobacteriaceae endosymbiont of Donacia versicolorea]
MILEKKYNIKNIDLKNYIIDCKNCSTHKLCIFYKLYKLEFQKIIKIIKRKKLIKKGEILFRSKDRMHSLFTVKSGTIKSYNFTKKGTEQIIRFYLTSDLIGLDTINNGIYHNFTKALETSMLCEIPISLLNSIFFKIPSFGEKIINLMSKEIKIGYYFISLLLKKNAEIKLATFIYDLSKKFKIRGYSPKEFNLSMNRSDIGNYLGLTVETISRILNKFKKSKMLIIHGKHIIINNYLKLIKLIN